MTDDRQRASWPAATYNGFSGPVGGPPPPRYVEPPVPRRRSGPPRGVVLGAAAALAGGIIVGMVSRPVLDNGSEATPARMEPARPRATVPVEVAPPSPVATPSAAPLEVLPPASAAREPAPVVTVRREPAPPPVAVRPEPQTARAQPPPVLAPAASATPSFNCRFARTRAENMVCGDAELAQLDRRLDRAFRRAVASGVPYRQLRAEQDDWLEIREFASRRSPDDVASIYRQRIAELNEIAE